MSPERKTFTAPHDTEGPRKVVIVRQEENFDCCVATVLSAARVFRKQALYEEIIDDLGTTKEGTKNVARIIQTLKDKGLRVKEYKKATIGTLTKVLSRGQYCLVEYQAPDSDYRPRVLRTGISERVSKSLNHGHYSLVFGVSTNEEGLKKVWLMDPLIKKGETKQGEGIRVMSEDLFVKRWQYPYKSGGWMLAISARPARIKK